MSPRFSSIVKWVVFCCAVGGVAFGISTAVHWFEFTPQNESKFFTGTSFLFGFFQGLSLWVVRGWAEVKVGEGFRSNDSSRILKRVKRRKKLMLIRLAIGIVSALLLQGIAAIIGDATGKALVALSSAGYFFVLIVIHCTVIAIVDWHQQQELVSDLNERLEEARRRNAELDILNAESDDKESKTEP